MATKYTGNNKARGLAGLELNFNERPEYVLKTTEAVLMPTTPPKTGMRVLRYAVWVIVAVIILGSFVLGGNLFMELQWSTRILLVCAALAVTVLSGEKREYTPSPIELWFYRDYLVIYQPKRYYSANMTRREYCRMNYREITKCAYLTKSDRIQIYGSGCTYMLKYNKDGSLPKEPTEIRNFKEGMIYFKVSFAKNINFKQEIERHSPLRMVYEDRT